MRVKCKCKGKLAANEGKRENISHILKGSNKGFCEGKGAKLENLLEENIGTNICMASSR